MAADSDTLVFYDVTRLVSRRRAPVATGIDRIDLHFARAVLDAYGERCLPVVKVGKRAFLADRPLIERLVASLEGAWFDGAAHNIGNARALESAGLTQKIEAPSRTNVAYEEQAAGPITRLSRSALRPPRLAGLYLRSRLGNLLRRDLRNAVPALMAEGRSGVYVVCSHGGAARLPGLLSGLREACGLRSLAYVHDLLPLDYPEYFLPGKPEGFARFLSELAAAKASFIANSRDTAVRLEAYSRRQGWTLSPVPVIWPGVEPSSPSPAAPKATDQTETPYFVVIGTIEPRKNHLLLLQIWRDLALSGQRPMPYLHIVGRRGWENQSVLNLLDRCEAIQPHVSEHSSLPDPDLRGLVAGARAVLFPSFAEGFGMPVLEALQLGARVIAADLPVLREFAGDAPLYLDPLDARSWRHEILDAAEKPRSVTATPPLVTEEIGWEARSRQFLDSLADVAAAPTSRLAATEPSMAHLKLQT